MEEVKSKNCNAKELPSQQYLLECFDYDPEGIDLVWKERPLHHFDNDVKRWKNFNSQFVGKVAGSLRKGYVRINFNKSIYLAHRLIWRIVYGVEPEYVIDHIDGDGSNNRISNLRDITAYMNSMNRKISKANKSGYDGVHYCKKSKKWRADINLDCKKVFLGHFDTEELAALAREIFYKNKVGEEFYIQSGRDKIFIDIQSKISNSDNRINKSLIKRNTSGYTGVTITNRGKYRSGIKFTENGKHKELLLGYYNTPEEAALAREIKFKELKGSEYYTSRGRDDLLKELEEKVEYIKNTVGLTEKDTVGYITHTEEHNKKVSEGRLARRLPYDELPTTLEEAYERGVFILKHTKPCRNGHLYGNPIDRKTGELRQCVLCRYENSIKIK